MTNILTSRKISILILVLILVTQCLITVHFAKQKISFFVDEELSYSASNYKGHGYISDTEGFINSWRDGVFFHDALTIDESERFDLRIPIDNNVADEHPLLYFCVINIASSFVPGVFSKWIGIIPNIVFNLFTSVAMYLIMRRLLRNDFSALLAPALWGIGIGGITTAVYIRMYAMETCFCTWLLFAHIIALEELKTNGFLRKRTLALFFAFTTLSLSTQYFSAIFCLFVGGCFFVHVLCEKNYNNLLKYVVVEIAAILVSVTALSRNFFVPTEHRSNMFGYISSKDIESFKEGYHIISSDLFAGLPLRWIVVAFIIIFLSILGILVIGYRRKEKSIQLYLEIGNEQNTVGGEDEIKVLFAMIVCIIGYFVVSTYLSPWIQDRFYMCIYPMICVTTVFAIDRFFKIWLESQRLRQGIMTVLLILLLSTGFVTQDVAHLFQWHESRLQLQEYKDYPAIVINNTSSNHNADAWLSEYQNYTKVFRCACGDNLMGLDIAAATADLSKGFVLYVVSFDYDSSKEDALFSSIREHIPVKNYELITSSDCYTYFCYV